MTTVHTSSASQAQNLYQGRFWELGLAPIKMIKLFSTELQSVEVFVRTQEEFRLVVDAS